MSSLNTLAKGALMMVLLLLEPAVCTQMSLWLFTKEFSGDNMHFKFSKVGRCYSIASCFSNQAHSAVYRHIAVNGSIAFYDGAKCEYDQWSYVDFPTEDKYKNKRRRGNAVFPQGPIDKATSSFMVWPVTPKSLADRFYPTQGFVDICAGSLADDDIQATAERATVSVKGSMASAEAFSEGNVTLSELSTFQPIST